MIQKIGLNFSTKNTKNSVNKQSDLLIKEQTDN